MEKSQLKIRQMRGPEAGSLVNPFYTENAGSAVARDSDLFFIAFLNSKVSGCVRFCVEDGVPLLRSMMIQKELRGQRIGHALLLEFEKYLDEQEIKETFCIPYGHLDRFYGNIGFEVIAEKKMPDFLQERISEYRAKRPDAHFICMMRP